MTTCSFRPKTLAIIPSFRCNAACDYCCFGSSPDEMDGFSVNDLEEIISRSIDVFSPEVVVFTGGEPTLAWDQLKAGISIAKRRGVPTRVVSNAGWAATPRKAEDVLQQLCACGLTEINFSTGSRHSIFVPISRVFIAVRAAVERGMRTVVVIERDERAEEIAESFVSEFQPDPNGLTSLTFNDRIYLKENLDDVAQEKDIPETILSCEGILRTVTISPDGLVFPCCGLPIREMKSLAVCTTLELLEWPASKVRSKFVSFQCGRILSDGPSELAVEYLGKEGRRGNPWTHPCQPCVELHRRTEFFEESDTDDRAVYERTVASVALWGYLG